MTTWTIPWDKNDPETYLCRTLKWDGSVVLVTGDDGAPEVDDGEAVILHAPHERHLQKLKQNSKSD